jgi:GNAT superfamily N-acetyltransferase
MKFIKHISSSNNWGVSILIMESRGKAFARIYWFNDKEEDDEEDTVYLDMLSVNEEERRKGIGTKLQDIREKIGKRGGATYSCLWVYKNTWMYEWYKRRGYKEIGKNESEKNAVWMRKKLI